MNKKNDSPPASSKRTWRDYLMLSGCGFIMGAADVVPGVSGGTMAFILGIYEELINSIRSITEKKVLQALLRGKFSIIKDIIPWKFLLFLGMGIAVAIISLAKILKWLLHHHPIPLWSFFFGLIIASIYSVCKQLKDIHRKSIVMWIICGSIVAYLIVGLVPVETPTTFWFLFLCGSIAICAMILPGISGSFILLILGKYQYVITAVSNISDAMRSALKGDIAVLFSPQMIHDITSLSLVAGGCFVGIITFARVLSWLFKHYHDPTVAILIGLMVGSLRKIWPWKKTIETIIDRHGNLKPIVQINVLPNESLSLAIFLAIIGFAIVFILDRYSTSLHQKDCPPS